MRITIDIGGNQLTQDLLAGREIKIEETDLLFAGERQKTRIIERTISGKDFMGNAFAPYSTNGPYYYYPQKKGYKGERRAIVKGFQYRVGGGAITPSGLGIKFESYAEFKRSLGRVSVDLMGPRAPHMLHAIVVQVQPGPKLVLGVWGAEADRAEGHNEGIPGRLPQRRFLDVSPADLVVIGQDIATAMAVRLTKPAKQ